MDMDRNIIGKVFNPEQGNARAACVNLHTNVVGIITKGDDADQTIASFQKAAKKIGKNTWDETKELWDSIKTDSPVMMFSRSTNSDSVKSFYRNLGEAIGKYPNDHVLKASMIGMSSSVLKVRPELSYPVDFYEISNTNKYCGTLAVVLSTAPYNRKEDWATLQKAVLNVYKTLCSENPEEQWDAAGEVLRNAFGADEAYVIIVYANTCRDRSFWNIPEGELTKHRLKIDWSKKGWALMSEEYNESTSETIQARIGSPLSYEGFGTLYIKEITDNEITLVCEQEEHTLTPGETIYFHYNDSYEDHEGVEWRDINHKLEITWL